MSILRQSRNSLMLVVWNVKGHLRQDLRRQIFSDEAPIRHLPAQSRNSIETIEILKQGVKPDENYQ